MWQIIIVGVFVILICLGILAVVLGRGQRKEIKRTGKYPEGYLLSIGIALGIPIGLPIGLAMDNIALGPGFGIAIGVAIGAALESKYKKEGKIRALTKQEKKNRKLATIAGIILVFLGVAALLTMIFLT